MLANPTVYVLCFPSEELEKTVMVSVHVSENQLQHLNLSLDQYLRNPDTAIRNPDPDPHHVIALYGGPEFAEWMETPTTMTAREDASKCRSPTTACHDQQNNLCAQEDSDQPGHLPSLIRVLAVRMTKHWVLSYTLSAQRRL